MSRKYLHMILIGFILTFSACYEPVDGCLDIYASNYAVASDEACVDCCTYPDLILRVIQKYDSLELKKLDTLENDFNQKIVLHDMSFLVNGMHLTTDTGSQYGTEDSIDIHINDSGVASTLRVADDVRLVIPRVYNYNMGQFTEPQAYRTAEFQLGLSVDYERADRDQLPSTQVLINAADTLYNEELGMYSYGRLEVQTDPTDSLTLKVFELQGVDYNFIHVWNIDTSYVKGQNVLVELNMDYRKWLGNIDWSLSDELIQSELRIHFKEMFD